MVSKNLRFSKDFNLPVNIFNDEMFAYYRNLYDFWPINEEKLMDKAIEELGGVEKFLEYCGNVRDAAINGVMESEAYKKFNNMDMSVYSIDKVFAENGIEKLNMGERSCFSNETDGKIFISVDLKKANFQAMKYAGVIDFYSYEDFVNHFAGDCKLANDYISRSKYLRQVIFGKMNPKRTITVERYITAKICCYLTSLFKWDGYELFSFNNDELIYSEIPNEKHTFFEYEELHDLEMSIKSMFGIDVRIEFIRVKKLDIVNSHGSQVDAYVRYNFITGENVLKKASTTFYPQIYKLWHGMNIVKEDMTFFFEDQLATFNEPLILK